MENKIFYTHGIYRYNPIDGKDDIFVRNTDNPKKYDEKKYIPLPLKLREALKKKWVSFFHVQKNLEYYGIKHRVEFLIDGKVEFTIGFCPEEHITVITICHPFLDAFKRSEGFRWAKMRMEWALENPDKKERWWLYRL